MRLNRENSMLFLFIRFVKEGLILSKYFEKYMQRNIKHLTIQVHDNRYFRHPVLSTFLSADVWKRKNRIYKETGLKRVEKRCFVVGWVHLFTFYFYENLLTESLKICRVVFLSWHRNIIISLRRSMQTTLIWYNITIITL